MLLSFFKKSRNPVQYSPFLVFYHSVVPLFPASDLAGGLATPPLPAGVSSLGEVDANGVGGALAMVGRVGGNLTAP